MYVVVVIIDAVAQDVGYKLVLPDDEADYDSEDDLWIKSKASMKKVSFKPLVQNNGTVKVSSFVKIKKKKC